MKLQITQTSHPKGVADRLSGLTSRPTFAKATQVKIKVYQYADDHKNLLLAQRKPSKAKFYNLSGLKINEGIYVQTEIPIENYVKIINHVLLMHL